MDDDFLLLLYAFFQCNSYFSNSKICTFDRQFLYITCSIFQTFLRFQENLEYIFFNVLLQQSHFSESRNILDQCES